MQSFSYREKTLLGVLNFDAVSTALQQSSKNKPKETTNFPMKSGTSSENMLLYMYQVPLLRISKSFSILV